MRGGGAWFGLCVLHALCGQI